MPTFQDVSKKTYIGLIAIHCPICNVLNHIDNMTWYSSDNWVLDRTIIKPHTNILSLFEDGDITYYSPEKNIIWEPQCSLNSTIIRTSSEDGNIALFRSLSQLEDCFMIRLQEKENVFFTFWGKKNNSKDQRVIQYISNDTKNEFYQEGVLLNFENPLYYERKKKKDRINKDIIVEYMSYLGWYISEDTFWVSNRDSYLDIRTFPVAMDLQSDTL